MHCSVIIHVVSTFLWLHSIEFLIYSTTTGHAQPASCGGAIGLQTGALRSHQFSASSTYEQYLANEARLNDGGVGWIASENDKVQYLKIDLEGKWIIRTIAVQGASNGWYTRRLRITYSDDDIFWFPYNSRQSEDMQGEIIEAYEWGEEVKLILLDPPIKARYLAFNPYDFDTRPSLRLELYGCFLYKASSVTYTTIDQDIEDDRTYIPSQSPVIVDSLLMIRPSGSLTIQAGVSFIFTSSKAGLRVFGTLNATGVNGSPVSLTGSHPVLDSKSKWVGLKKESGGIIALEETVIRHASTGISGAGEGISIRKSVIHNCNYGLQLSSGQGTNDTYIMKETKLINNTYGIDMHGNTVAPYLRFFRTEISQSTYSGMLIRNWDGQISDADALTKLDLNKCRLGRNAHHGLDSSKNIPGKLTIRDSSFSHNLKHGVYVYQTYPAANSINISISATTFLANTGPGIYINLDFFYYFNLSINQNNFSSNGLRIVMRKPAYSLSTFVEMKHNLFKHITSNPLSVVLDKSSRVFLDIENNTFVDTQGCIFLYAESEQAQANVRYNKFVDIYGITESVVSSTVILNFTHNAVENASTSAIVEVHFSLDHNIMYNNFTAIDKVTCLLSVGTAFDPDKSLIVSRNFWGYNNLKTIKMKLCDFFLDASVARVKVLSYFTSSSMDKETLKDIIGEDIINSSEVSLDDPLFGGILLNTLIATNKVNPTIINRSIIVEDTGSLLLAGSTFSFAKRRGVVVKGLTNIGEDNAMQDVTILQSNVAGESWNGFYIYGGHLTLVNTNISDAKEVITFKSPNDVTVRSLHVDKSDNFISARYGNGNLSLSVQSSVFDLEKEVVLVQLNNTRTLDVTFNNCSLQSRRNQIIAVTEKGEREQPSTTVTVDLDNCNLVGGSSQIIYIKSCCVDLNFTAFRSNFSSIGNSELIYISVGVTTINVAWCNFTNGGKRFHIHFWSQELSKRYINIQNNTFSAKMQNSPDIYYVAQHSFYGYMLNIENNVFKQDLPGTKHTGLYVSGDQYVSMPNNYLIIKNNTFQGYNTALYFNGSPGKILISQNKFLYNSYVLKLEQDRVAGEEVNITSNVIKHNSGDGILRLRLYLSDEKFRTNIIGNAFENNTGSVIWVTTPFISIRNNFFDNQDATYNLEIPYFKDKSKVLNASLNYWGSTDVIAIAKQIYDASYDESLCDVVFRPYLGSRNISDILDEDTPFLGPNGEIGGTLRKSIRLIFDDSPYIVVSNIEIEEGGLTLEAGVTLLFRANLGISVFGSLLAYGNASHPVQLLSENPEKKWRGIDLKAKRGDESILRHVIVNNTLFGVTIDLNISKVSHVKSDFSKKNGFVFNLLHSNSSWSDTRSVEHISASNNTESGILVQRGGKVTKNIHFEIRGCLVRGNSEHGVLVEANASVTVVGCAIIDNRLSGVHVSQNDGGSTHLFSCNISLNRKLAVYVYTDEIHIESCNVFNHNTSWSRYGYVENPHYIELNLYSDLVVIIRRNKFYNNTSDGIGLIMDNSIAANYSYIVEDNLFLGGCRALFIEDSSRYTHNLGHLIIRNNTFINVTAEWSQVMYLDLRRVASFSFEDNKVIDSSSETILHLTGEPNVIMPGKITIYGNKFTNNKVQSTIIANLHYTTIWISNNVFTNAESVWELIGPLSLDVLNNLDWSSTFSINATYNYWGDSRYKAVFEKVCGFEQNMTKAFIYYIPYYTTEELTDRLPYNQDDFDVAGVLGGEITGEITVSRQGSPYIISRSLMIRKGSRLIIEDGTLLQFKSDRGIYASGSLESNGRIGSPVTLYGLNDSRWYGIVINSTTPDPSELDHTKILQTKVGLVAHSSFVMSSCNISNSSASGVTMRLGKGENVYDFAGTTIEHINRYGILLSGNGNLTVVNVTVRNVSEIGIFLNTGSGHLTLLKSTIQNSSMAADVYFTSTSVAGNFTMRECKIINNTRGVSVKTRNNYVPNMIEIHRNDFINNAGETLRTIAPSCEYHNYSISPERRYVDIGYNYFENSGDLTMQTWNYMNLTFYDNTIIAGHKTLTSSTCMMNAFGKGNQDVPNRIIDISTNVFEKNVGDCIVYLNTSDGKLNGSFFYNQLLSNKGKDAVLKINTTYFHLLQNIFDNPETAFDLYVTKTGDGSISADNNWWGSASVDAALDRIVDFRRDIFLLYVNITPILINKTIDCSIVNNCSGNGECVRPNGCRCNSGWAGLTCMEYDCAGVSNCYGNGQCIGPNTCECSNGWTGDQCVYATCTNVNDCSRNGICIQPDVCTCAEGFTGNDCSDCVGYHWGPQCKPCPPCVNGFCDLDTGLCTCSGNNWAGYLCDTCNERFYGPECLTLVTALDSYPSQGRDTGNYNIDVQGEHFRETQDRSDLIPVFPGGDCSKSQVCVKHSQCKNGQCVCNSGFVAIDDRACFKERSHAVTFGYSRTLLLCLAIFAMNLSCMRD